MIDTNVWFGESWGAPVCELTPRVLVPVGEACQHCEEPIAATDSGWGQCAVGPWMHVECFMRLIHGSVLHQLGVCRCRGGGEFEEPPDMSPREAARAAWEHLNAVREQP